MPTILDNLQNTDRTVRIFDGFYRTTLEINAAEFDVVFSFFKSVSETEQIAGNFTSLVFRIAQESDINALDLIAQLKGLNNTVEINKVLCYFINTFKSKSALYGVGVIPRPNKLAARNVVV